MATARASASRRSCSTSTRPRCRTTRRSTPTISSTARTRWPRRPTRSAWRSSRRSRSTSSRSRRGSRRSSSPAGARRTVPTRPTTSSARASPATPSSCSSRTRSPTRRSRTSRARAPRSRPRATGSSRAWATSTPTSRAGTRTWPSSCPTRSTSCRRHRRGWRAYRRNAMTVVLRPISAVAAEAILAGRAPEDVRVAPDYPTEISSGVAERVGAGARLGPYFVHRAEDDVVVGEIGGAVMDPVTVGSGYAIVRSCWGNGYATDAVRALVARALQLPEIELIVAFTPLDRPASGRVLRKAGFTPVGEEDDEHEGKILRVIRWELATEYARAVDDVLREERALQAAMLASDVEALDRILHPELL